MDKKNTTIGILLLIAAFASVYLTKDPVPPPPAVEPQPQTSGESTGTVPPPPSLGPAAADPTESPLTPAQTSQATATETVALPTSDPALAGIVTVARDERLVSLSNDFIEARFTDRGGALAEVVLKKYPESKGSEIPYVLNALRTAPTMSLLDFPGADNTATYELVQHSANSVIWRTTVAGQVEVTRTYTINPDEESGEPYLIRHETKFRNLTEQALNTPKLIFGMGTAEPIDERDPGISLNVGVYDGESADFIGRDKFTVGWFGRMIGKDPTPKREIDRVTTTVWGSVKNQFFTTIVIPDEPGNGVSAQRVELPIVPGEATPRVGIRGRLLEDPLLLGALETQTKGFNVYAGPKEYKRLVKLGDDESPARDLKADEVMQFGWAIFAFFSKLLIHMLGAMHNVFAFSDWAWGWAIIATTVIIRTMMWPITAQASKSAKRMAKIQGPMKEIQEKYKDNKQKQQEETLKLFREHKINPIGGCLPMFIQLPIFFGLFRMLQSASELRFAEFLWVPDLSAPERLFADVLPLPLNIMPLLMGATMFIQMRMTPTPTTDNASAKMMKIMPFFITAICYTFSSGLAVYWTASNLFSIFQQWVTNRRKDPLDDAPLAVAGPAANQPRRAKGNPHQHKRKKKR